MLTTALAPGLVVAGKYSLVRPLARGAMGEVWIATHQTLGNEVAVKFLARTSDHEGEDEATAMARFRFEAQVASKLSRKTRHIVAVTDHGEELGFAYLVMELVDGESLETMMRREGVFHRDLKPANVLLTRDEDGGLLVKILDFGIAKTVRSHKIEHHQVGHSTDVGIVLGTPNYMSPEQARGLANLDHRCDLWALATVIYEALSGVLPYDGETTADLLVNVCSVDPVPVRTHRRDLPESLEAFFTRAFAAKAKNRFQDAASFAAAFAEVVAGAAPKPVLQLVESPPAEERSITGVVDAATYEPPRSRMPIFVALAAVMVLGVVFFFVRGSKSEASPPAPESPSEPRVVESAPPPLHSVDPPAPVASSAPVVAAPTLTAPPKSVKPSIKAVPAPAPSPTMPAPPPAPSAPAPKKPVDKGEIL